VMAGGVSCDFSCSNRQLLLLLVFVRRPLCLLSSELASVGAYINDKVNCGVACFAVPLTMGCPVAVTQLRVSSVANRLLTVSVDNEISTAGGGLGTLNHLSGPRNSESLTRF
jgi:hypothetical protein